MAQQPIQAVLYARAVGVPHTPMGPRAQSGERRYRRDEHWEVDEAAGEQMSVVIALFGTRPDYRDPAIEALWREIHHDDPINVFDYCRSRGVEVLDEVGEPVPGWRDIAVMLRLRDLRERAA